MISIKKFSRTDYDTLISWVDSAETLMQFAGPAYTYPLSAEQLDQSLSDTHRHAFKIIDNETDNIIGHAEVYEKEKTVAFGRILIGEEQYRGRGIGQQIVYLLLEYAFANFDKDRVELNVFDWNTGAIKCYEKTGFGINQDVQYERTVNGKTWIASNMIYDRTQWKIKSRS